MTERCSSRIITEIELASTILHASGRKAGPVRQNCQLTSAGRRRTENIPPTSTASEHAPTGGVSSEEVIAPLPIANSGGYRVSAWNIYAAKNQRLQESDMR